MPRKMFDDYAPYKHKQAARELDCDDDPERFRERAGKLVMHKPAEKPE